MTLSELKKLSDDEVAQMAAKIIGINECDSHGTLAYDAMWCPHCKINVAHFNGKHCVAFATSWDAIIPAVREWVGESNVAKRAKFLDRLAVVKPSFWTIGMMFVTTPRELCHALILAAGNE